MTRGAHLMADVGHSCGIVCLHLNWVSWQKAGPVFKPFIWDWNTLPYLERLAPKYHFSVIRSERLPYRLSGCKGYRDWGVA